MTATERNTLRREWATEQRLEGRDSYLSPATSEDIARWRAATKPPKGFTEVVVSRWVSDWEEETGSDWLADRDARIAYKARVAALREFVGILRKWDQADIAEAIEALIGKEEE